ncbi:VOC family protein [Saccharomonospora xinjiangensis]|uniref:VOC family protein n=1 Tax=Saccharomonospora xinjiangensis TaxID=75294 RepID=UPI0010C3B180|nr:VOC family protein [Saccharomonospora xinjiangensis]QBQ61719.1 Glyoxalase-like domain protein [Saccharomonospora xinjiangensis]
MITKAASTVLYGGDQDKALEFYRNVLGFEVVVDTGMGGGSRWIEVRPPGAQTSIVLSSAAAFGRTTAGEGAYLTFAADDVAARVAELHGGVVSDPVSEPWGMYATVESAGRPRAAAQRTSGPLTSRGAGAHGPGRVRAVEPQSPCWARASTRR